MTRVPVRLAPPAETRYDILIAPGLLNRLGERVAALSSAPSAVVISDTNVGPLYGARATRSFSTTDRRAELLSIPAGEENKHLQTVSRLWDGLAGLTVERSTPIVALGGGVVGDVAGFVAACYLRGLPIVQAPTTLLACVDSSVGGKTGVDHPTAGKNIIGAFHQPIEVLIDPLLLASLPQREWACGLAESVKHGMILDAGFFDWIEGQADALAELSRQPAVAVPRSTDALVELIARNCQIKADVVAADEKESGLRAVLNFGHTIGHAVETLAGYGRLRHGEAVSIGMAVETQLAVQRGLVDTALLDRLAGLLARLRLPVAVPSGIEVEQVLRLCGKDKKVRGGKVRYVLPSALGRSTIVDDVTAAEVAEAIRWAGRRLP